MKLIWSLTLLLFTTFSYAQFPQRLNKKMGLDPVIFIDSVESDIETMKQLSPFNISNIDVFSMKAAKKRLGNKGADGAIFITTIKFAKENYWKFCVAFLLNINSWSLLPLLILLFDMN